MMYYLKCLVSIVKIIDTQKEKEIIYWFQWLVIDVLCRIIHFFRILCSNPF
ncbi:MAG: hypothetical protein P857_48 [Candidatus Xenolissoclinum pacificiensis L6]|uniref:Uncharacterized protein n=1 Tax=Candidatus Xenolissoclinum pacificiensis L6 TaxID=1401685 RepID=W2UZR9_9RICK|nr:MAG: hypothetical protein P857_48 [Candidatus Xenolissoclinum pacificiensis L6]